MFYTDTFYHMGECSKSENMVNIYFLVYSEIVLVRRVICIDGTE